MNSKLMVRQYWLCTIHTFIKLEFDLIISQKLQLIPLRQNAGLGNFPTFSAERHSKKIKTPRFTGLFVYACTFIVHS